MPDPRLALALDDASSALGRAADGFELAVLSEREGVVTRAVDGVVDIRGLSSAGAFELVTLGRSRPALVLGFDEQHTEAVLLCSALEVRVGDRARATGRVAAIGVGDGLLGRVVDPLGAPLDGMPAPRKLTATALERTAPRIFERAAVHRPMLTGSLVIDAMLPIGRGQRELILGNEGTGKTSIAIDAMLRQRTTDVVCVYAAIGRRRAETWAITELLRASGVRFVIVSAPDDVSAGLRYLAPYAATSVAEHFAYRGDHALIVYDDLSSHAAAWRELSLLLRRPPGRDAYPGDVFYLHARLLERAAQLAPELGGGSLTALPIASLASGRLTSYIPTNLISITDGQIVLSEHLFASGQRPAVDVGLSVSRVGARAQPQALRELSGPLRIDYASFLELETFSRLGTKLDPTTERRLAAGERQRALLRAPRLLPLSLREEVVRLVLANETELLLRTPVERLHDVVQALIASQASELAALERDAVLPQATRQALVREIVRMVAQYEDPEHGQR